MKEYRATPAPVGSQEYRDLSAKRLATTESETPAPVASQEDYNLCMTPMNPSKKEAPTTRELGLTLPKERPALLSDVSVAMEALRIIDFLNQGLPTYLVLQEDGRSLPRTIFFHIVYGSRVSWTRRDTGALACVCRAFKLWFNPNIILMRTLGIPWGIIALTNVRKDHLLTIEANQKRETEAKLEREAHSVALRGSEEEFIRFMQDKEQIVVVGDENYATKEVVMKCIWRAFVFREGFDEDGMTGICIEPTRLTGIDYYGKEFVRGREAGHAIYMCIDEDEMARARLGLQDVNTICERIAGMWKNVTFLICREEDYRQLWELREANRWVFPAAHMKVVCALFVDTPPIPVKPTVSYVLR